MPSTSLLPEELTSEWAGRIAAMMLEGFPGVAAAVHHRGRILWARGFGFSDLETRRPMGPGTVVRLGGMTKLFTAAAVMLLRDAGALQLDDLVARHVPEFPSGIVTVRQLLCHASGLQREAPLPRHVVPRGEALRAVLPEVEFLFPPFARWKYSSLGYCVLGELVERVAGEPYTDFVTSRIIEPLGMDEVTFEPAALPRIRMARGYRRAVDRDSVTRDHQAWDEAATAAGQLFGTALDLCTFGSFLAGDRDGLVLRTETLEEMRRPAMVVDQSWDHGQGLGPTLVRRGGAVLVGHAAVLPSFSGWMLASPETGVGAVLMANAGDAPALPVVASMIEDAARHVSGPTAIPAEVPAPAIEQVLGRYASDGATLVLAWRGGRLVAHHDRGAGLGPSAPVELESVGTDTFRFLDGSYCGEAMRVLRHPSGRIHGFEVCNRSYERI